MAENEELEQAKEKTERKKTSMQNIPLRWKIAVGAIIFILVFYKADSQINMWWWIAAIIGFVLWLGKESQAQREILTEPEAKEIIRNWIKDKEVKAIEFPVGTQCEMQPECDLKYHDSRPEYYLGGLIVRYVSGKKVYFQIKCDAWSGNCTMQRVAKQITGNEAQPTKIIDSLFSKGIKDNPDLWRAMR